MAAQQSLELLILVRIRAPLPTFLSNEIFRGRRVSFKFEIEEFIRCKLRAF